MNSPALLPCTSTGERQAFEYVVSKLNQNEKLVIFDVGANRGGYTAMCLNHLGPFQKNYEIFAFEPSSDAHRTLAESVKGKEAVRTFQIALGRDSGEQVLYMAWDGAPGATFASTRDDLVFIGTDLKETVTVKSLDNIVAEHGIEKISLLKLDVEGAELEAIAGAERTLSEGKIRFIQFEISGASMLRRSFLLDFWHRLSTTYKFHLVLYRELAEITSYNAYFENFAGAANFLLELKQ